MQKNTPSPYLPLPQTLLTKFNHVSLFPLSKVSTLKIGGAVPFAFFPKNIEEASFLLKEVSKNKIPYWISGFASNTLFPETPSFWALIKPSFNRCLDLGNSFYVESGASLARFARKLSSNGFSGLEWAAGIPASFGGAIFMNAGVKERSISDVISKVFWLSPEGEMFTFSKKELFFGYRSSTFMERGGLIVGAEILLKKDSSAKENMEKMLKERFSSQPYKEKSLGCAFKNPPLHSAGALIDKAGLKGFRIGGCSISHQHANFFINDGKGRAEDYLKLLQYVKLKVFSKFKITIDPEVQFCGSFDSLS